MVAINRNMYHIIMNILFSIIIFIILNRDVIFDNKNYDSNLSSLNESFPYTSHLADFAIHHLH